MRASYLDWGELAALDAGAVRRNGLDGTKESDGRPAVVVVPARADVDNSGRSCVGGASVGWSSRRSVTGSPERLAAR
jgi:hypothetical protein